MARDEAYLRAEFHLDLSNRLATVHERYRHADRQTGQDRTGHDNGPIAKGEPFYKRSSKNDWLARDAWSNRTPGLFKLEFSDHRAIALCSKCYFVDGDTKSKYSSKGMSARLNNLTWGRDKAALE